MTPPATPVPLATDRYRPAPTRSRRVVAALVASAMVAIVAFAAGLLALFLANGQSPRVIVQAWSHFAVAAVIAWALLSAANLLGALRARWIGLLTGLAAGVVAGLVATTFSLLASGRPFVPSSGLVVVGSLVGLDLVFVLATVLGQVFIAPAVHRRVLHSRPHRPERRLAFVRIPASNLEEGLRTYVAPQPVDTARADEQWDNYCAALVAEGWETVEVDAAPDLADSAFVEDTVVMFGDLAVLARPGAESRRAEVDAVERALRTLPGLTVARIEAPGTLDGGDVLKVGSTVYVGASGRTNGAGIRQLRALLAPHDVEVVAVPVTGALHLKTACTALPDGTVIGDPDLVPAGLFPRFLAVPETLGAAVVELSPDSLLMSASAPKTAQLLSELGYRVVTVDISEFEKLEGGVTCLSVRVR